MVLQEKRNGSYYEVDSKKVTFAYGSDENGTASYSFTEIPNEGKEYRIQLLLLNYTTEYDNEGDTDTDYHESEYTAVFAGDNVAKVHVKLTFVPPSYDQELIVETENISEEYIPQNVLAKITYRDTGDNHPFQVISQHRDSEDLSVNIALTNGEGNGKESIWKWHTQIVATVLNLLLCLLVMQLGGSIHMVKLTSVVVFLLNPLVQRLYVKHNYKLSRNVEATNFGHIQKRDGAIHHLSYFIHRNTDVVILSLLGSLQTVSVYAVYHTVINVLEQLLVSISSGLSGLVGRLIARKEILELNRIVDRYEACNNVLATGVATVCAILILPFVSIYTGGVTDAQYHQPLFAVLMIAGSYAYSIRHPFGCVVSAAGHYRATKAGAIGEVAINLALSIALVKPLGLVGVALGTFVAMSFRTIHTVWYLSKHILHRPVWRFLLKLVCNLLVSGILIIRVPVWLDIAASDIPGLFVAAIKVSAIVFPVFLAANALLSIPILKEEIQTKNIRG